MVLATYLLIIIGFLGAFDIALYHTHTHNIRKLKSARTELIFHSLRGPTYAILFLVIPNFATHGAYCIELTALLVFDVAISILDFAVERKSREPVGGLPSGEYVLHSIIAMLFGAFVLCVWNAGVVWIDQPTALIYEPVVNDMTRGLLAIMSLGVLISGIQDAVAVVRLGRKEEKGS